jgi:predicted aspartyl protease
MKRLLLAAMAGLGLSGLAAPFASAEECKPLRRYAQIPFQQDNTDHIHLPVTLGGVQSKMMLDTGAYWSIVRKDIASQLGLQPRRNYNLIMFDGGGNRIDESVMISEFRLGQLSFGAAEFFVSGIWSGAPLNERAGVIGQNLLTQLHLEIDNAGKTISLFSQDHCAGDGVYWADEAVILKYERSNARSKPTGSRLKRDIDKNQIDEPIVTAELAGKPVRLLFDTGATFTSMDLEHARRVFGITKDTPGVQPAGSVNVGSGARIGTYRYVFPELTISGIRFENVPVLLGDFDGSVQVILGMNEMKKLRLFFAFKEGAIYVTAADARRSAPN